MHVGIFTQEYSQKMWSWPCQLGGIYSPSPAHPSRLAMPHNILQHCKGLGAQGTWQFWTTLLCGYRTVSQALFCSALFSSLSPRPYMCELLLHSKVSSVCTLQHVFYLRSMIFPQQHLPVNRNGKGLAEKLSCPEMFP